MGYDVGKIDGNVADALRSAVSAYQEAQRPSPDGYAHQGRCSADDPLRDDRQRPRVVRRAVRHAQGRPRVAQTVAEDARNSRSRSLRRWLEQNGNGGAGVMPKLVRGSGSSPTGRGFSLRKPIMLPAPWAGSKRSRISHRSTSTHGSLPRPTTQAQPLVLEGGAGRGRRERCWKFELNLTRRIPGGEVPPEVGSAALHEIEAPDPFPFARKSLRTRRVRPTSAALYRPDPIFRRSICSDSPLAGRSI